MWSSGDIRDASPGFALFCLHIDDKTDTAACSETIARCSSVTVSSSVECQVLRRRPILGKGPLRGCWSSVSLGFDRVVSVTPCRELTGCTRLSGVNSPPGLGDHLTS